ncbi:YcaO-like family protein [Pararhizobium arenae]|uniref:YcaO-like family protein n=1 Tax=Pararhizobium arenae TaxID=1856850 RepID=UPI00094AD343|nr:YcaO-like family protein [Pararhizobium arenae]
MDRACSPDETFNRVSPYLKQFGITRVARHTGLDHIGVPVWCAYTPNSRSIVVAQGKGLTDADARISAVMEALERATAGAPAMPGRLADMKTLMAEGAIVDAVPELLALGQSVPNNYEEISWLSGQELISRQRAYVPGDAAVLDRTRTDHRYWMSSDGLASGNTTQEAILHGILERIERDAFVLWQVTAAERRYKACVDPKSFQSAAVIGLVEQFGSADLTFRLFDITSDIGIPTFACFLAPQDIEKNRSLRYVDVTYGCGTHPDPQRAVMRAMTEAAQSRMTFISGARDDAYRQTFEQPLPAETGLAFKSKAIESAIYQPAPPLGIGELLEQTLDRLKAARVPRVIAVPLHSPGLPFSVVKIFIPALENPDDARARRFGPRALSRALLS